MSVILPHASGQQKQINLKVDIKSLPEKNVDGEGVWTSAATLLWSPNSLPFHFIQSIKMCEISNMK